MTKQWITNTGEQPVGDSDDEIASEFTKKTNKMLYIVVQSGTVSPSSIGG